MARDETPICTARLRLEPLGPQHAHQLFDALQSPDLYTFTDDAPPASIAALEARFARLATRRSPEGTERWLNWALRSVAGGAYVGYVQATVRAPADAEIAYVVFPPFWRRGYASEAARAMIDVLVECHEVRTLLARVDRRNRPSVALLERLGFVLTPQTTADVDELTFRRGTRNDHP